MDFVLPAGSRPNSAGLPWNRKLGWLVASAGKAMFHCNDLAVVVVARV